MNRLIFQLVLQFTEFTCRGRKHALVRVCSRGSVHLYNHYKHVDQIKTFVFLYVYFNVLCFESLARLILVLFLASYNHIYSLFRFVFTLLKYLFCHVALYLFSYMKFYLFVLHYRFIVIIFTNCNYGISRF